MFAKTIIDSDAFLDMPLSTQSLYFHLSMRADDEGFLNNPKKIQRMIGASDDDLRLLIAKKFLIPFESGIVVIKHWRIHNYIQSDRFKPTVYTEEREMLKLKKNKAYSLDVSTLDTECIHDGYNLETQDRLGKDSIVYNNSLSNDKEYIESDVEPVVTDSTSDTPIDSNLTQKDDLNIVDEELHPKRDRIDYRGIQNDYNAICVSFPMCKLLSDKRKKEIKACVNNGITREDFRRAFEKAQESSFMKGNNNRGWQASFDWIIKLNNLVKILDGNYDNKQNAPTSPKFTPKSEVKDELDNFYTEINEWANKGN